MRLILGFPFELFLYRCVECSCHDFEGTHSIIFISCSILSFLLALLTHCAQNGAHFQLFSAAISCLLVLSCLITYWLITEPRNDVDTSRQQHQAGCYAASSVQGSSSHFLLPQTVCVPRFVSAMDLYTWLCMAQFVMTTAFVV